MFGNTFKLCHPVVFFYRLSTLQYIFTIAALPQHFALFICRVSLKDTNQSLADGRDKKKSGNVCKTPEAMIS